MLCSTRPFDSCRFCSFQLLTLSLTIVAVCMAPTPFVVLHLVGENHSVAKHRYNENPYKVNVARKSQMHMITHRGRKPGPTFSIVTDHRGFKANFGQIKLRLTYSKCSRESQRGARRRGGGKTPRGDHAGKTVFDPPHLGAF